MWVETLQRKLQKKKRKIGGQRNGRSWEWFVNFKYCGTLPPRPTPRESQVRFGVRWTGKLIFAFFTTVAGRRSARLSAWIKVPPPHPTSNMLSHEPLGREGNIFLLFWGEVGSEARYWEENPKQGWKGIMYFPPHCPSKSKFICETNQLQRLRFPPDGRDPSTLCNGAAIG